MTKNMYRSTEGKQFMRPGHHWLLKFGDAGDGTSCEKKFHLTRRSWEDYKGSRFYNGQQALAVERWLNRVGEDASGLTFEEWNPTQDADASQPPVAMLINSSELRAAGFTRREMIPPALEAAALGGKCRYGTGLCQLQGMGPKRVVLSADNNNEFRSRCECIRENPCFC